MSEAVLIWLAVAGLLTTGVAAVGARSLVGFSRHELEEVCRRREAPQRLGDILRQYERVALAAETLQVLGMAVALAAAVYWATLRFHEGIVPSWQSALAEVGAFSLAMLVAAIWLPWTVARLYAEPFLFFTWPLCAVSIAMTPLVFGAGFLDTVLHRLADRQRETSDEESFEDGFARSSPKGTGKDCSKKTPRNDRGRDRTERRGRFRDHDPADRHDFDAPIVELAGGARFCRSSRAYADSRARENAGRHHRHPLRQGPSSGIGQGSRSTTSAGLPSSASPISFPRLNRSTSSCRSSNGIARTWWSCSTSMAGSPD